MEPVFGHIAVLPGNNPAPRARRCPQPRSPGTQGCCGDGAWHSSNGAPAPRAFSLSKAPKASVAVEAIWQGVLSNNQGTARDKRVDLLLLYPLHHGLCVALAPLGQARGGGHSCRAGYV